MWFTVASRGTGFCRFCSLPVFSIVLLFVFIYPHSFVSNLYKCTFPVTCCLCLSSVKSARVLSKNNRVVDEFVVMKTETKTAVSENEWLFIKEKIIAKLKRRSALNTPDGDPQLLEQASRLLLSLS